jgi:hypothetical protein
MPNESDPVLASAFARSFESFGFTSVFLRGSLGELVENVKVSLIRNLPDHSRLFQQVIGNVGSDGLALGVEFQLQVLSEP